MKPKGVTHLSSIKTTAARVGRLAKAPSRVRIIGGRYRRTTIPVADRAQLRPTPDRVRETLFNWLSHLYHDLESLRGLDLFAGTGALGFELASRGASRVALVERDPALVARLIALRDRLGAREVEVIHGDAIQVARGFAAASFDLVFVDPPYEGPLLEPALAQARRLIAPGGSIYAEWQAPLKDEQTGALGLHAVRTGRAGRVHFHLLALQQS
ncbi:MAG TPA: RsmD family RNA methyltransferase [Burkholderiaceae bacterium]